MAKETLSEKRRNGAQKPKSSREKESKTKEIEQCQEQKMAAIGISEEGTQNRRKGDSCLFLCGGVSVS